jgi:hypothetical protein
MGRKFSGKWKYFQFYTAEIEETRQDKTRQDKHQVLFNNIHHEGHEGHEVDKERIKLRW